jgi:transposase
MVRETGKPIAQVARDLGINEGTLGNWVNRDRRARGEQRDDQVSESGRAELLRLRRENVQLRMVKEILNNASGFFVTESTKRAGSASSRRRGAAYAGAVRGATPGGRTRPLHRPQTGRSATSPPRHSTTTPQRAILPDAQASNQSVHATG